MKISVIFAASIDNVIGVNNKLPWETKFDLEHFRYRTFGKIVIMGRKTWESLDGIILDGRTVVVISKSLSENLPGNQVFVKDHYVFPSLLKAIDTFHQLGHSECCIVGGKKLIEEGIELADKVIFTIIDQYLGDKKEDIVQLDICSSFISKDIIRMHVNGKDNFFNVKSTVSFNEETRNKPPIKGGIYHLERLKKSE